MLEEMRKKSIKSFLPAAIILLILGIGALVFFNQQIIRAFKSEIEFYEIEDPEDLKYRYANITVDFTYGCFAEYYTEDTTTKIKTTKDLYYVIDTKDYTLMGIKLPKKYKRDIEAIADQSYDYYIGESSELPKTLKLSGYIDKMSSKEYGYYKDWVIESFGITEDQLNEKSIPFVLKAGNDIRFLYYVIAVTALFFILLAIIRLIYIFTGGGQKALIKYIKSFDGELYKAESDYGSAVELFPKIKIGRLYTFYRKGSKNRAIRNAEIVWAYYKTTTHRTNGVKTGTTYEAIIYTKDKSMTSLPMKKEDDSLKLLEYINKNMPKAVIGYTDDLLKLFKKNYQEFLNIAYNRAVEEITDPYTDSYSQEPSAGDDPFASELNKTDTDNNI